MINTAEHELAKYLDSIIKIHIPDNFMLRSTTSFIDRIKTFTFSSRQMLVSFDVVSLFTNIPLKETTDIVADLRTELKIILLTVKTYSSRY